MLPDTFGCCHTDPVTIKDALFRELKYGLCGSGGTLESLMSATNIEMDMRTNAPAPVDGSYPFIVFRSVNNFEDNQINYTRERVEIELIGLRSSPTKGDDLLQQMRDLIKDHFMGRFKTIGKFTANGAADPNGGLKVKAVYINTVEGFDESLKEKAHIMIFIFTAVRE